MRVSLELQSCCGNMTGIGTYTYELARRLKNTEGITFQGNIFNFLQRRQHMALKEAIPFEIVENSAFPYGVYRRIWNFLPVDYESFFGQADITHFFNYCVPPRIHGKVITTIHDMTYFRYPETMSKANILRLRDGLDYSIQRSSLIVTSSEFSKKEIVELCRVPECSVAVVYPAVDADGKMCRDKGLFERLGIRGDYLLFVGAIEPRKNLVRLLRAFDCLIKRDKIDFQLVLCGGNGWNSEDFFKTLKHIESRKKVILTGYLPAGERNALYANARAVVFPSIYEGFGMPVLEAMHWETPVICSNVASLPEVAGDAACYVDPFSEESIAEGIFRVITDELYSRELAEKGVQRLRMFSWDDSAQKLINLYKMLV